MVGRWLLPVALAEAGLTPFVQMVVPSDPIAETIIIIRPMADHLVRRISHAIRDTPPFRLRH